MQSTNASSTVKSTELPEGKAVDGNGIDVADSTIMCSFCSKVPAALNVKLPVLGRKKRAKTPYCLRCYYTTSAVRQDPDKFVSVLNEEERMRQLPEIQTLFSECFLELQQELSEESVRAFQQQKIDPLAMLSATSSKKRKSLTKGESNLGKKKAGDVNDGGFLRDIALPECMKKTQQMQAQLQQKQIARMNEATKKINSGSSAAAISSILNSGSKPNQRRKGSGKSIWNLAMDSGLDGKKTAAESYMSSSQDNDHGVVCTCGSKDVKSFGNVTSRNDDVRKGEIWGTGRDSVITRFQCNQCGRTWNEED